MVSTWTAPSGRWRPSPRPGAPCCAGWSRPTALRSTSTNGRRCRTIAAASWSATRRTKPIPFAQTVDYLRRDGRGLAGGHPWPCDLGPDLSRGFRALKVWMTLAGLWRRPAGPPSWNGAAPWPQGWPTGSMPTPALERLAPVPLNIVCFRVRGA